MTLAAYFVLVLAGIALLAALAVWQQKRMQRNYQEYGAWYGEKNPDGTPDVDLTPERPVMGLATTAEQVEMDARRVARHRARRLARLRVQPSYSFRLQTS